MPAGELGRKSSNGRGAAPAKSKGWCENILQAQTRTTVCSKPAHIWDLESELSSRPGTKVRKKWLKSHKLEFYSLDEFDRIAEKIGLPYLEEV